MNKSRIMVLAGIVMLALAFRLAYVVSLGDGYHDPDEGMFVTIARNLTEGRGLIFSPYRKASFPPLYPLSLAGLFSLGLNSPRSIRVVQAAVGAVSCLWLVGICRLAFRDDSSAARRAGPGELAGVLMAIYPMFIYYAGRLMTETLFIFLLLLGIFLLLRGEAAGFRGRWLELAGAVLGGGILCRPVLVPLIPWCLLFVGLFSRGGWRLGKNCTRFLIPLLLVLFPWGYRNYLVLGKVVLLNTQGGNNLYLANNELSRGGTVTLNELISSGVFHLGEDEEESAYSQRYGRRAVEFIRNHPGRFLGLTVRRLAWFYHLDGHNRSLPLVFPLWVLLGLGLTGIWLSRRYIARTMLLLSAIVSFTAVHMIFLPEGRYRLPIMPFFIAFAAFCLYRLLITFWPGFLKTTRLHRFPQD